MEQSQFDLIQAQLTKIDDDLSQALTRLTIIETRNGNKVEHLTNHYHEIDKRLNSLEQATNSFSHTFSKVLDTMFKVGSVVLSAAILYKLGIK